jgi:vacuolar-type H+-ATPase subunit E/Vma4
VDTVGQMTQEELRKLIEALVEEAVEQKLVEMLGDPDKGLALRETVRDRLLQQRQAVAAGERGQPLADVMQRLGLE